MPTSKPPKPDPLQELTPRRIAEFALEESRLSNLAYRFQLVHRDRVPLPQKKLRPTLPQSLPQVVDGLKLGVFVHQGKISGRPDRRFQTEDRQHERVRRQRGCQCRVVGEAHVTFNPPDRKLSHL